MRPPTTVGRDDLSRTQRELLAAVAAEPGVYTASSLAAALRWDVESTRRDVGHLRGLGLLWPLDAVVPVGAPDYRRWPVDDDLARAVLMALADGLTTVEDITAALCGHHAKVSRRTIRRTAERLTVPPSQGVPAAVYPRRTLVCTTAGHRVLSVATTDRLPAARSGAAGLR